MRSLPFSASSTTCASSSLMMSEHSFTHSSQMNTPLGPWMSLRTWLLLLPQNEQCISGMFMSLFGIWLSS